MRFKFNDNISAIGKAVEYLTQIYLFPLFELNKFNVNNKEITIYFHQAGNPQD